MFSFLRSRPAKSSRPLTTDIHSHLLAAIDDGVRSKEEALAVIRVLQKLGYSRIVTTPHIIHDYYRNDPVIITQRLDELKNYLSQEGVMIEIQAAAEYYLDEAMVARVDAQEPLLVFGDRYVLFETNMISEPYSMKDFIFKLTSSGYKPILAHPERYAYMNMEKAEDLRDRGILFQINMLSIIGFYGKPIQHIAHQLIDRGWIEWLGSDCHNIDQANLLQEVQRHKYFQKAVALPLLNHTL